MRADASPTSLSSTASAAPAASTASTAPAVKHYSVAVIGYGPVGATLAGLLGRYGLSVAVFEKSTEIYPQPRAVGFDHDAMRLFQRIGVADALTPHIAPFRDSEYFGVDGQLIQGVRRIPPPFPLTWAPNYTCDQPGLESVLRGAIADMDSVDVFTGCEVTRFLEEDARVQLHAVDAAGAAMRCSADFVVACDGASSPVRRRLGIELENFDYDEPWIVVDVRVNPEHLDRLPQTNVQYCQPERPSTFIFCPGNHRRWEFMTLPGEPASGALSEERLWKLLAPWLKPDEANIWRAAAYRFHALVAHQWRRGRVLLAGDSAHQTPPFLGQGMCQGLRDVGNLAWKLEQVLRGHAPAALLDSYEQERRPHVVETTRIAKAFGGIISERDPAKARERDERMLGGNAGEPRILYRQDLIPGLHGGLHATGAPLAGKVFPQPRVQRAGAADILLDDLTGPAWRVVLCDPAQAGAVARLAQRHGLPTVLVAPGGAHASDNVIHVSEPDGLLRAWLAAAGCGGALVRPDHSTFGAFATPADAASLLAEWAASPCNDPDAAPAPRPTDLLRA